MRKKSLEPTLPIYLVHFNPPVPVPVQSVEEVLNLPVRPTQAHALHDLLELREVHFFRLTQTRKNLTESGVRGGGGERFVFVC